MSILRLADEQFETFRACKPMKIKLKKNLHIIRKLIISLVSRKSEKKKNIYIDMFPTNYRMFITIHNTVVIEYIYISLINNR